MALQRNKSGTSRLPSTRFEYDVFLSFRGEDTRKNFTGFFHYILKLQGIHAFFDEEDLSKGERIERILEAITKSTILVPIFSQGYAGSKWCLKEVAKMVECVDGSQERLIIPIFFDVDPKHVKDVLHQRGPLEPAFKKHQEEKRDEVDGWRKALAYVGGISGYHLKDQFNENQWMLVDSIIDQIQKVLATKRLLHEEEYLVGVDVRVEEIIRLLDFKAEGARIIGIHGIGGIGKTTLAKAIYNRSRHLFKASCFIANVREVSKLSDGLVQLQQQLVQDISKDKHKKVIHNSSQGAITVEDMVHGKSVLLVLDDVDDQKQLDALGGNISRFHFHSGSRVIVTTRQKKILEGLQVKAVYYSLEELEGKEAVQLFNHHAFGADGPQEEYSELIEEVVLISNRLPLALQVFGALFKKAGTLKEWKNLLKDLKRHQHKDIHEKLKICYDSLGKKEKQIFLDIACLLVGKNSEDAIYVWEDLDLSPHITLGSLQDRSLIKINKGKFEMHDQIRDMGREVVSMDSLVHPRSRLWDTEDIRKASTKSQRNMIEGIVLNVHEGSEAELSTQAFELLSELRILHINFAFSGVSDFRHFPESLKWLEWKDCPLETLPLESKFKSIVVLNLSGSSISKLWSETTTGTSSKSVKESFVGLKVLDLSSCHCLIATPNFALAPNLEKLILDQCISLKEVDDSIGYLKELEFLSMRECVSLEKLPNKIFELSSLQVFNLEGCRELVDFPQIPEDLKSAVELDPDETSTSRILYINQTPHIDVTNSTIDLSNQKRLILRDCGSLKFLPCHRHMFPSLRCLHIDGCLQDMAFRVWDIEAVYISGSPTLPRKQEFSFVLPVGLISDPLLLQQLRCHGCGDPSLNGTMVLTVHRKDLTNERWIALGTYEFRSEDSNSKDDVYGHSYTINFGSNDKIHEVPRGKTTIMKVTTSNDCKLTKVDVKLQNRSKFSGENMKPFISISRTEAFTGPPPSLPPPSSRRSELEVSIFLNHYEEVKLHVIKYSTGIGNCIDQIKNQLNVQCDELTLLFGWTIKELIIAFTLFLSDIKVSYELGRGTGLRPPAGLEVYVKIKILDLSYCRFLVKTHDFAWSPNLEKLVLDHCEHLLEIDESIGRLKTLIRLSVVGCTKLRALPYGILQLKSLKVLNIGKCPNIKMLPEASMQDVSLDALEVLILDECTSLTGIPDYVERFKSLRHLSLRSCHLLTQLPDSIGKLKALEKLLLDGCTSLTEFLDYVAKVRSLRSLSLTEMPNHIGRLKSLRSLSLRGCPSVKQLPDAIGSLVLLEELLFDCFPSLERLPDSIGSLMSLTKMRCIRCPSLTSMPDLSGLMALEELIVAGCSSIAIIPGLEKLISLKVLHMCGCQCLDLGWIRLQLQEAEFHDLEAFNISAFTSNHYVGIPFPVGRCTSSKPLLVEKIDVLGSTNIDGEPSQGYVRCEIKVAVAEDKATFGDGQVLPSRPVKDGVPCYVDAYRSRVDSLSHWERLLWLQGYDEPVSLYSAGIGEDDEINERLRVLTATSSDHGSRVGTLNVSCSGGNFCAEAFVVHMVSPNCRRRRVGLIEHWIGG